jgi:hypothetical protein
VRERWHGEDRRGEDAERRDDPCPRSVEALQAIPEAACGERETKDEDAVCQDRADERGLHEVDQTRVQREQRDEQLRQVAERRLNGAGARRAESAAELFGRRSDCASECGDRERRQREAENGVPVEEVGDRGGSYEDRVDGQFDLLPPVDGATLPGVDTTHAGVRTTESLAQAKSPFRPSSSSESSIRRGSSGAPAPSVTGAICTMTSSSSPESAN